MTTGAGAAMPLQPQSRGGEATTLPIVTRAGCDRSFHLGRRRVGADPGV